MNNKMINFVYSGDNIVSERAQIIMSMFIGFIISNWSIIGKIDRSYGVIIHF